MYVYKQNKGQITTCDIIMIDVHPDPLQHKPTPYLEKQRWETKIEEMLDAIQPLAFMMTRLVILFETWAYVSVVPKPTTYVVLLRLFFYCLFYRLTPYTYAIGI